MQFTFSIFCIIIIPEILEKVKFYSVQGGLIRALPTELSHKSCGSGTRTHDIGLTRTNKDLLKPPYMAEERGIEPLTARVKVLCSTNCATPLYKGKVFISIFPFHLL